MGADSTTADKPAFGPFALQLDSWRWAGVPFRLLAGKRLQERVTAIVVTFEDVPHSIFLPRSTGRLDAHERLLGDVIKGNLTLCIHRDELDEAWRWIDPMRETCAQHDEPPKACVAGTWRPAASSA